MIENHLLLIILTLTLMNAGFTATGWWLANRVEKGADEYLQAICKAYDIRMESAEAPNGDH